MPNEVK